MHRTNKRGRDVSTGEGTPYHVMSYLTSLAPSPMAKVMGLGDTPFLTSRTIILFCAGLTRQATTDRQMLDSRRNMCSYSGIPKMCTSAGPSTTRATVSVVNSLKGGASFCGWKQIRKSGSSKIFVSSSPAAQEERKPFYFWGRYLELVLCQVLQSKKKAA